MAAKLWLHSVKNVHTKERLVDQRLNWNEGAEYFGKQVAIQWNQRNSRKLHKRKQYKIIVSKMFY